ncbi:glycosyl hydrolase family 28-related protein [Geothrix sp. PMB-07]|uniref:Ig-like domain-containing protein n=1 Tax=Geothrix sp. PMB-07 TaxID=3068640 RepID=UPI002741AA54|nr:glycosyl hydrolase family 28-related protein [Geothrix sp. PMB-07]WLT31181.1 glycosyl hydrolase family 28-related protein [Geothrix sp. PMB-07]
MRIRNVHTPIWGLVAAVVLGLGCGGESVPAKGSAASVSVTLDANPKTPITQGGSVSFTATVSGSANTAVTWTVDNVVGGNTTVGTLVGAGVTATYTAPATAGAHTIKATSAADPSKSASVDVTVTASLVQVSLNPVTATLASGATQAFTVTVSGTTNAAVTWSVDGVTGGNASAGTLAGTGATVTYTAPTAPGGHTIKATSAADPSRNATASVTVTGTSSSVTGVSVSPGTLSLTAGAQGQFTPTVSGTGSYSTAVTWSALRGRITSAGVYTAPSTSGSDLVTATSVQDNTKTGIAAVTVTPPDPGKPTITGVTVSPASWILGASEQKTFTATVTGTGAFSPGVTWSAQRGNIDTKGLYTAPGSIGSDVVTATSSADATKSGVSAISVQTGCAPAPTSAQVVNVRNAPYGAKGDGSTDDTAAIQAAVNAMAGSGGTV